ncbi:MULTISPECIES: transglycosylase SLT domain-containing protein [Acetobacter]|uniref:Transglycosylase SLT domain-containing protein n=1 Tax=Acetobacter lovaniensis TaxID=104100 RepID=A0A841QH73_9PROT|nr:transglycosylase SLT domain-containing protein [Acetobacter lovaniensis]MBB6457901.1 hypothetical protein [Acetobacter lovaniensis]NHN82163.1 transglycosylase SLT domain-containing protein [Acetobacter lovaniensis]GBQ66213.1 hypothetical protein AA0474_1053 [Acetobacter lovaniensis NRIC 0474]
MATVIDALVVTLGLDPNGVQKGGKEAGEAFDKTKAKAEKVGKDIEASGVKPAEFFTKMRNSALSFFAVMTAGKTLKAFVSDTVASNASLERTSRRLNMTTKDVYALQKAVDSVGGSGDAATASIQNIQSAMTDPAQAAQLAQRLSQLGVSDGIDIKTGQINDISKFYQNLAENRTKLANAPRVGLLQDIGLDQGSIDLVLKGGNAVKSTFSTYESFGKRMQENAEASEKLQAQYKELIEQNRVYAQELEGHLLPALTSITGAMSDFEKNNPGLTKGLIGTSAAIAGVGTAILGVLSIVGGVRFLRALKNIERLVEGGKIAGKAEKAAEKGAGEAAKEAAPAATKASRAARIGRIASRAFGGLNIAVDAYTVGDMFWNGASPSLSKNDTNNAAKKMFLSKLDAQYGLPAGFMDAIWARESSRGANAKPSSAGALGDFQIMPGVAKEAGVDPMNFEQAARYAAKRFHNNFANYGGSLSASIAEYNWGGGNLSKSMSQYGGDWQAHAPRETQNYISGVNAALDAVRGMPRGAADASQNTTHNTVNVGEIKVVAPSPERAGDAVQRKIVEMRTAASFSNSGAA